MSRTGPLPRRLTAALILAAAIAGCSGAGTPAVAVSADDARVVTAEPWRWPVTAPFRIDRPFLAPAHAYGPGHRGIDLLPASDEVRAPAGGVVAYAGDVAGRGIVTIDHGEGLVTTLEPVDPAVGAGAVVAAGDTVGTIATGGHTAPGRLHLGVRLGGEYINPLLLLGGLPRAVLLPCCAPLP